MFELEVFVDKQPEQDEFNNIKFDESPQELEKRKETHKKLEEYLEKKRLKHDLGLDDYEEFLGED